MSEIARYRWLHQWANHQLHPRICNLRDRANPLEEYNNEDFHRHFRFGNQSVIHLEEILRESLEAQSVLIALRLFFWPRLSVFQTFFKSV